MADLRAIAPGVSEGRTRDDDGYWIVIGAIGRLVVPAFYVQPPSGFNAEAFRLIAAAPLADS